MQNIKIYNEYIKLDQFLKYAGITQSGADAKLIIKEGKIKVNGIKEIQRGKKLKRGDVVEVENKPFKID